MGGLNGLVNSGNLCYLNSLVQVISHTETLRDQILAVESSDLIVRCLSDTLKQLWSRRVGPYNPTQLKAAIGNHHATFEGVNQQDVHELMCFLFDHLDTKLEGAVGDFCNIQDRSVVKCFDCGNESVHYDSPASHLSLFIPTEPGNISLIHLLKLREKETLVSDYKCCNDSGYSQVSQKISIARLPPCLIIHFKRFKQTTGGLYIKNTSTINFPFLLNVDDASYELYSVINHTGSLESGHYVAYCLENDVWYKFDDTKVSKVNRCNVVSSNAYVLFYRRKRVVIRHVKKMCSVLGCEHTNLSSSMFTFPKVVKKEDYFRCFDWIKFTGNETLLVFTPEQLNQKKYICAQHFSQTQFVHLKCSKKTVVPTLNQSRSISDDKMHIYARSILDKAFPMQSLLEVELPMSVEQESMQIDIAQPNIRSEENHSEAGKKDVPQKVSTDENVVLSKEDGSIQIDSVGDQRENYIDQLRTVLHDHGYSYQDAGNVQNLDEHRMEDEVMVQSIFHDHSYVSLDKKEHTNVIGRKEQSDNNEKNMSMPASVSTETCDDTHIGIHLINTDMQMEIDEQCQLMDFECAVAEETEHTSKVTNDANASIDEDLGQVYKRVKKTCCVTGCGSTNLSSSLFSFPNLNGGNNLQEQSCMASLERCLNWIKFTGNEDLLKIHPSHFYRRKYVCANHFKEGCFVKNKTGLKRNAIPTEGTHIIFTADRMEVYLQSFSLNKGDEHTVNQLNATSDIEYVKEFEEIMKSLKWHICSKCKERSLKDKTQKLNCVHGKRCDWFSAINNMDPGIQPDELKNLTFIEEQLIARVHPLISVFKLKGVQYGYKGNVISFPQAVKEFAAKLPHSVNSLSSVITVRCEQGDANIHEFRVRANVVRNALLWLKRFNPYYADIEISEENIQDLPEDDFVFSQIKHVNVNLNNEDVSDTSGAEETIVTEGEADTMTAWAHNEENNFGDKNVITIHSSGVPHTMMPHPNEQVKEVLNWPAIDNVPVNEFKTPGYICCAFPSLFPYGLADLSAQRGKKINPSAYFKHMMNFHDQRFAQHSTFRYFAMNSTMRWTALTNGTIFLKNNPEFKNMTAEKLKELLKKDKKILRKIMFHGNNLRGTKAYWHSRSQELKDMVEQLSMPTIFLTLSFADLHVPDLYRLLSDKNVEFLTENERRVLLVNNPAVVDLFFLRRFEAFLKYVLKKKFGIIDFWFRIEYQHRGSPHMHGLFWFKDGYKIVDFQDLSEEIRADIVKYFDCFISAIIPLPNCSMPEEHPCRLRYEDVREKEEDLSQLLNTVQKHVCSDDYCIRVNKTTKQKECRFHFPIEMQEESSLTLSESGFLDFLPARNHPRINKFNDLITQSWRANSDIAAVVSKEALLAYLGKYISKADTKSNTLEDLTTFALSSLEETNDVKKTIQRLLIKTCGERDYSAQEVNHILLGLKLYSSGGRKFVHVNLSEDKDWVPLIPEADEDEESTFGNYGKSFVDKYKERPVEVEHVSLFEAASSFNPKTWRTLNKQNIVRVFPKVYLKDNENDENYYRIQVLLHIPWREESLFVNQNLSWKYFFEANNVGTRSTNQVDLGEEMIEDNYESDSGAECVENISTEEWMIISNIGPNNQVPPIELGRRDVDLEYDWSQNAAKYSSYGTMKDFELFIQNQKTGSTEPTLSANFVNVTFNAEQAYIVELMNKQIDSIKCSIESSTSRDDSLPKRTIVNGKAGTGKSLLINFLRAKLEEEFGSSSYLIVGYTGVSALSIQGQTIHSALHIPTSSKKFKPLGQNMKRDFCNKMEDVQFLIIDEYSMVGSELLGMIDYRCREGKGEDSVAFGNLHVYMFGDKNQLPPVGDVPLYSTNQKSSLSCHGKSVFHSFEKTFFLEKSHRQEDAEFCEILDRLSTGENTDADYKVLAQRFTTSVSPQERKSFADALHIFSKREEVDMYNFEMLKSMTDPETEEKVPVARIAAKHNNKEAERGSSDDAQGLDSVIYLAKGAKIMLRSNIWVAKGLVNGSMGHVVDILYNEGEGPPDKVPAVILCSFDSYQGPSLIPNTKIVPIIPIMRSWTGKNGNSCTRIQFPICLCYACTIHKCQGMTLLKVYINIGDIEFSIGLSYVGLSRVKSLGGLLIESFPFSRISNLKHSPVMQKRRDFDDFLKKLT